jgi:hypothetical protein
MKTRQLAGLALAVLCSCVHAADAANADDADAITPYRPSVSSPAQLPVAGQLEVELGGLHARSDEARRSSLPYAFKLAFNKEWGVVIGGEAHVRARDDSGSVQGLGDTTRVLSRAWIVDDASAFGAELGAKLPTANDRIGSGRADYTLNTIYSRDIGPVDALKQSVTLLKRTWGENAVGQVGIGAAFGLLTGAAVLVSVGLVLLAAQASVALAIAIGAVCVVGVLLLGVYQAALTGIYSAVLYRYAVSHDMPEAFRGTDLALAFAPKR